MNILNFDCIFYNVIRIQKMSIQVYENYDPQRLKIRPQQNLYPFCIVWTLLPCISWILPWIGHTGICDDKGVIHDFLGYHINVGEMAFGNPKKYVKLNITPEQTPAYLNALNQANKQWSRKAHDLCCNNCHHHVAYVLNLFGYRGRRNWNQVSIWWLCLKEGKYVAWWMVLLTYLPLIVLIVAIVIIKLAISNVI